jgi:uncharacterized protein
MPAMIGHQKSDAERAAEIIRDAGGQVVGRTRLQKMAYLLEIAGLGSGFSFEYRHYGPFSEDLADGVQTAQYVDLLKEEEHSTWWGGSYSIFKTVSQTPSPDVNEARKQILRFGVKADPIALELAATAAFLALENYPDPWGETSRRKPEKAEKSIDKAKALYERLRSVKTPKPLPII